MLALAVLGATSMETVGDHADSIAGSGGVNPAGQVLASLYRTPFRFASLSLALVRSAPARSAPATSAPMRSASVRLAPVRLAPVRSAPVRSASVRLALVS